VRHATNRIDGFAGFVDSWQNPAHPQNLTRVRLRTTAYGNLNVSGKLGDYRGYILSRWHPRFVDFLEPGIKDLVLVLVEQFHWVTYSSCEGHYYGQLGHPPVERMVGICPRSPTELNLVQLTLHSLRLSINRRHRSSSIRLAVVTTQLDADGSGRAVVDLVFRRRPSARWKTYFKQVDGVYRNVLAVLEDLSGRDLGCDGKPL
jgi:hypothetical protein